MTDYEASQFAAPLADAGQQNGGNSGCEAVAYGQFWLCHTPNAAEDRPLRARSWRGFYLAISRLSDFNSRNRLTRP